MASRDFKDLLPELQVLYVTFLGKMREEGQDFVLTCTYRSQEEQNELFEIGRTKTGKKVTWIKNSKHTERKAFDIAILKNGKISWLESDYLKAGEIGTSIGLEWGGLWTKKDLPHFQLFEV
jgi:peptidoglycan L-alanyl-D-glutamate endopeptidase CwlK